MPDDRDAVPTRADRPGAESKPRAAATDEPVIGRASTAQRYLADREIARGGMGRVVEAIDTVLGRTVALKEALVNDEETLQRFARETRITAKLEHPSIVPVYDAGTAPDGTRFYVMRRVSGQPLDKLVDAATTLNARLALVPHVLAAAQAIAHAHKRSILHRDVKPPNILVGELGETVVIDWGLAKELGEPDDTDDLQSRTASQSLMTRYGAVVGTPGFMPPEQVKGEPVDERGDVFALGATLYYVLTGKPPFRGPTGDDIMRDTLERPARPLREVAPGVPAELASIADTALAATVDDRYRDAGEMVAELQRFLAGQLVASHDYTTLERAARFVRRHRVAVSVVAIALVVIVVGGALAIERILDARDTAAAEAERAIRERAEADIARREATDRADELVVEKARLQIATNPTAAVAQIKRLATSKYWREVRDIAASARAAGVAWELPAAGADRISVAGSTGVTAGKDGAIRRIDLVTRRSEELARYPAPARAVIAEDGRRVRGYAGSTIVRIDLDTKARRDIVAPEQPQSLIVLRDGVVWSDRTKVYLLSDATTEPIRLDIPLPPHLGIWTSPDDAWLGVCTGTAIHLIKTAEPTRVHEIPDRYCAPRWWAPDLSTFKFYTSTGTREIVEVALTDPPKVISRTPVTKEHKRLDLQYGRSDASQILPVPSASNLSTFEGGRLDVRYASIAVTSPVGDAMLQWPTQITTVGAAANSPYVLALSRDKVVVWNLAEVLPRRLRDLRASQAAFVADDQLVTESPPRWYDLRTGDYTELPEIAPGSFLTGSPRGDAVMLVTFQGPSIARRGSAPKPVGIFAYAAAEIADLDHVIYAKADGSLISRDLRTNQDTILLARTTTPRWLTVDDPWIIAAYDDDTVWRHDRATGRSETQLHKQARTIDGTVYSAEGTRFRTWRGDGSVEELVAPATILSSFAIDATHAMVYFETEPPMLAVFDDKPRLIGVPVRDPVTTGPALTIYHERGAVPELQITDEVTGIRWVVGRSTRRFQHPALSRNQRYLLAFTSEDNRFDVPLIWDVSLPATAAATAAWLDQLTNVVSAPR